MLSLFWFTMFASVVKFVLTNRKLAKIVKHEKMKLVAKQETIEVDDYLLKNANKQNFFKNQDNLGQLRYT